MDNDKVILRKERAVARIVRNNPARLNAIWMAMWDSLDDVAEDCGMRVIVVSGAGGRAFSAGADISEFDRRDAEAKRCAAPLSWCAAPLS
jgi:enoyl-CoA hydratase/carnithine racemase